MGERFDDPALLGQAVANFLKENPMYRDDSIRIQTYA